MQSEWKYPEGMLYLGDCLEIMNDMKPNSVDLVFGSPPYSAQRKYLEDGKDLGIARKRNDWIKWMISVFKKSLRISKGLVAYVVGHGQGAYKWDGAPMLLGAELIKQGINLLSPCWYKRNGIMGSGGAKWLRADIEWILCATKAKGEFWSDNTACGQPPKHPAGGLPSYHTKNGRVNKKALAEELGLGQRRNTNAKGHTTKRNEGGASMSRGLYVPPEKSNPGNVIECGSVGGGHMGSNITHEGEASFPEQLAEFFVKSFCPDKGTVLDPFMGTGTTLAVAVKNNRKFIGVDIRKSQIKLQRRRLAQARINSGW